MVSIAAALLGAAVLCQPDLAPRRSMGGGFQAAGFTASGFHGSFAGLHNGVAGRPRGSLVSWLARRTLRLVVGRSRTGVDVL